MNVARSLMEGAADGALVLTSTKRLARLLRRDFDRFQEEAGRRAWPTPAIHSGDAWLQQAAEMIGEGWRLLGRNPARRLWERVIEEDDDGASRELLQIAATARRAEEAHALLCEYREDPARYPLTADHDAFLRWRRAYLQICDREGWLDGAALGERIVDAYAGGELSIPHEVWLVGFDDLPPRFRWIADALCARGAKVAELPPPVEPAGKLLRFPCADAREEVRLAARWSRALLEQGETEIGVIVPELERYRPLIQRIFREEIDPAAVLRPGGDEIRFNLSLGSPLAGTGAVAAALEILSVDRTIPLASAGFLLRSPYLGGSEREGYFRARLDRKLRSGGEPAVSLTRLRGMGGEASGKREKAPHHAAPWRVICQRLLGYLDERQKYLPGSWAGIFSDLLRDVGWPGERPIDSFDFQAIKTWKEKVLTPLATFDLVSGPVSRTEALALARRLAAETEFQPEMPESPVQVVGLLEGAGLRFRHLWVMGLHDAVLPVPANPNPFLPVPFQIAAGMPHADAGREAEFARRVARRLFAAAPSVVLSHPQREGDAVLLPSPLIREIPAGSLFLPETHAPVEIWRKEGAKGEELADHAGPSLPAGEIASGGISLLRDQALCPFRAFARHRLGASALEEPDIGIDPRERGTLLHKALEIFWGRTKDQAGLLALGEVEREKGIEACIAEAVETLYPEGTRRPEERLLRLERERVRLLVGEWLDVEAGRPPFAVVEREGEHRETFGGVEIRTRADRVDRLPDGSLVVLDYKTGYVDPADLVGERLTEPQLPVYGLARCEELAAVAFAALKRGKCAFAGVAREGEILPKVKAPEEWKKAQEAGVTDWETLLVRWRERLHALGAAFAAGEASVDPESAEKACRFCDLGPLCRSAEEGAVEGEEE